MSSRDVDLPMGEKQTVRIVKPERHAMTTHQPLCSMDNLIRSAAAIAVDFKNSTVCLVRSKESPLASFFFVCYFEKSLSVGILLNFGDTTRPVINCIEELLAH